MSSPKNSLVHFHKTIWFALAVFAMLILVFFFYVRAEKQIDRVNDLRHLSLQLSDELRQSSDDLTRMVRTYVVTGSPAYKQHFQDILSIRNGYKPRPAGYQGVYWDLILGDESQPAASEAAVPLLELMRRARYTEEEFAKLAEAKTNSDALTDTEFAAMALIESVGPGQAARRERAIAMVHDAIYHQAKADIMRPISEFQQMIEVRTNQSVEAAQEFAAQMRVVLIVIACLQIVALWWVYRALHQALGGRVQEIHAHIARLGRGDFATPIMVDQARGDSVLGWLAEMRARLEHTESERMRSEAQINDLAFFDQLSGLPNRVLLMDRLKQALATSSRRGKYGALLFIDLDNFKVINDTRGHEMGDQLLKLVAERLKQCVREGDTVARVGGDEFVLVLSDLSVNEKEAASATESLAEKILAALNQSYRIGDQAHYSSASIGSTLFIGQAVPLDTLMKQADLAMYRAKEAGRNVVRFFDPAMEAAVKSRAEMEDDLRRALAEGQFLLHYQAQVVGARVVGAEALVRWQHPARGMVSPVDFIPLSEECGLIVPLGLWVLQTACTQLTRWAARPETEHLTIAVNVSAQQFQQGDFVAQVLGVIQQTGVNPHRLKLELTESLLVHNVEDIIEKMYALKAKGVGFSLDDFGTGYSSLVYLKRLPLDQLKIDQSFVRDLLSDPNDAAIARTIVALAQSLGLAVIAEGVETQEQQEFLLGVGCHAYQGYLFGRPVAIEAFERSLLTTRV